MFIVLASLALAACGGGANTDLGVDDANDPYERFNRNMFAVNLTLDRYVLKPAAQGYMYVPTPARRSIRHFLNNLASPVTLVNDALQGEWSRAGTTTARFGINTILGIFGLFDPATRFGFVRHTEDFGQTLAGYGVNEGPYLFIPVLGSAPPRDLFGFGVDHFFDPITYIDDIKTPEKVARFVVNGVDRRAGALEILDEIERSSVDFYASIRSMYRQNRVSEIANGVTDVEDLPDIDDPDDF